MRTYHCVFPRPGCNVEALPWSWRERAAQVLAEWVKRGPTEQGCCCKGHRLLDAWEVWWFTQNGFGVAQDTEVDEL